jgi:acyl-CoA thioester hydrolase
MSSSDVTLADFPVHRRMSTRWNDDDVFGHVNNAAYYEYLDNAMNGWLHDAVGPMARHGDAIWVVAENSCRYLREITFPADLVVGLACERLGRTSLAYRLGIFPQPAGSPDGTTQGPAALARYVHVYIDRVGRRPVPIPAAVRAAVEDQLLMSAASGNL